ncbi:MAG: ligase-associated DNA damage response DEXH box helicase [Planctomycetota bacterium]
MRMNPVEAWFAEQVGEPFAFQRDVWSAQRSGRSGLLHAPTGMGKTYAAWLPALMGWCGRHPDPDAWSAQKTEPIRVLWITPLRALATDTQQSLAKPIGALGLPWTVERRTGDVSSSVKARQRKRLPSALVTTPESLSLLLSYADAREKFRGLQTVIVDEWHELMSTKRGTQTELGLARLRRWAKEDRRDLAVWGLSATLGNMDEASQALMGMKPDGRPNDATVIHGPDHKDIEITTLLPDDAQRFPWSGHLGLTLLPKVLEVLEQAKSTLLFTNTRSQAELWFNAINAARHDWIGEVALHHGSIDRKSRDAVEEMLRHGRLRCCVCTSSLDLGVDFSPVEQVIQVASPKGVARLLQRAGRSGHSPGRVSRVIGVPTNALEILDFVAARDAADARAIESRRPLNRPLDVLVQHLVTCAMGGGFQPEAMLAEVRTAHAYRDLSDQEWSWSLDFVRRGGETLKAYPQYARVVEDQGRVVVASNKIARHHRMGIGTITSDAAIAVKFANGKKLGTVEEGFVGFLKPGDKFVFAGHLLQLVRVRQMVATVKKAKGTKAQVPRWQGGKTPLSTQLASAVRDRLHNVKHDGIDPKESSRELQALAPLLELQARWSLIPGKGELLIETSASRDGHHTFLFPLQGRLVHEGLGTLLAHRLTTESPRAVTVTVNDYGIELLCPEDPALQEEDWRRLFRTDHLLDDLLAALNASQLARRAFRDIARVAGLISTGFPGDSVPNRHLQASSELFFDVFTEYDPGNRLLDQAKREVLENQLELTRLRDALESLADVQLQLKRTRQFSPLAFPLWAERLREQHLTSQSWHERVSKMALRLEDAAATTREVQTKR